jgi:hypothetical protein
MHLKVLFGKFISTAGAFKGLLRGGWGYSENEGKGWFAGDWFDAQRRTKGLLRGQWRAGDDESGRKDFLEGGWQKLCPYDSP